ncbi:HAMP domain-containing histidine kinase [Pendulispora brunnea]|uniref:histidine kinase n=1 Tax=Pendulispora brunnea TaxID=2905690 RepID=A0ABZ2JZF6_9BACT
MSDTGLLPRQRRRFSLRLRVMMAIMAAAVAPSLLVFAWSQVDRNVQGHMWGSVRDAAEAAVPLLENAPELERLAREYKVRLRVLDAQGSTLVDVDEDAPGDPGSHMEAFFLGAKDAPTLREFDEQLGPMMARAEVIEAKRSTEGKYVGCDYLPLVLCQAIYVTPHDGAHRIVHVQRSSNRAVLEVYALREHLFRLSLVVVFPMALALAFYMGSRVVRPIETLRRQALAKATAESPDAKLLPERRDEVGVLADAFNVLLMALEKKRADNEAFVADLVHEMKNPLAAVRAAADTLAEGADAQRAERLSRVLRESTSKLDRLVTQFLELARAEAGMPNEERSDVDLTALVRGLVESLRDDPRHAQVSFALKGEAANATPAMVRGVAHRLDALFGELLENAASFAGPGGQVVLAMAVTSTEIIVAIRDSGPGIAPEDRAKVFTRFFTTRGRQRGTGLGLSLVKAVAEAHGGRVAVLTPESGATFEVRLPRLA